MLFLSFFISPDSAEALGRWGGKIKYILTAYFLNNTCAKIIKMDLCMSEL